MDVVLVPIPTTVVLATASTFDPLVMGTVVGATSLATIATMKTYEYFHKNKKLIKLSFGVVFTFFNVQSSFTHWAVFVSRVPFRDRHAIVMRTIRLHVSLFVTHVTIFVLNDSLDFFKMFTILLY